MFGFRKLGAAPIFNSFQFAKSSLEEMSREEDQVNACALFFFFLFPSLFDSQTTHTKLIHFSCIIEIGIFFSHRILYFVVCEQNKAGREWLEGNVILWQGTRAHSKDTNHCVASTDRYQFWSCDRSHRKYAYITVYSWALDKFIIKIHFGSDGGGRICFHSISLAYKQHWLAQHKNVYKEQT